MGQTELSDTHPEAAQVQIDLLRKASFAKRFELMASLTHFARTMSRQAVKRANPNLSESEIDLLFVEYLYGKELADRVRKYGKRSAA